ncbi:MAG TPA: putative PEP-binding protein, partial [Gammaproteobacteria bacterium]|nr:putative PEP-binding protein [Gammaproteobacteria bacterium]
VFLGSETEPSEEHQYRAYAQAVHALEGRPLTIRTLDLGADKLWAASPTDHAERNPFLGCRSIRLCLQNLPMFKTQLRAILRASNEGPVRIMFPLISSIMELRQAKMILHDVMEDLEEQGVPFRRDVPVGIMIEVPSAAIQAKTFAKEVDFFSIGTNDLIQYTLAIDRIDDEVAYLYDPLHPAVLRLIQLIIQAGQAADIPVSMCGEMAGDPRFTRLLLGMGLTQFSMYPSSILEVKDCITRCSKHEAQQHVESIIACNDLQEIHGRLDNLNQDNKRRR